MVVFRDSFPQDHALQLALVLIGACSNIISTGKSKVTLRKLYVAVWNTSTILSFLSLKLYNLQITTLALKLVPGRPSRWPDWILSVITSLSGSGARPEHILEFLEIAAEEVSSSDLLSANKCVFIII